MPFTQKILNATDGSQIESDELSRDINVPAALPSGWEWASIHELCEKINSGFPSGRHNTDGRGIPHLRPMNISDKGEIDLTVMKYVETANHEPLLRGDILFNNTNSPVWVGKTAHIRQDTNWAYSNHMTRLRLYSLGPDSAWVAMALHYLFLTGYFQMHCTNHVNQASINSTFLSRVQIPLPPLAEQRRIVEAIEAQLTQLDAGVASLRAAQARLKRYKAAVLKAACEGGLVPQEPADEPADVLLRRILDERRARWEAEQIAKMQAQGRMVLDDGWRAKYQEPQGPDMAGLPALPSGWVWASIEQLAAHEANSITDGPFGSNLKTEHYTEDGPKVIRLQNIGNGDFLNVEAHISYEHFLTLSRHQVFGGDVVIAALGESLPRACIVPATFGPAIVKADCIRFRPHSSITSPQYMNTALNSEVLKNIAGKIIHGIGRPRLNSKEIKALPIPFPPLAEQQRIVAEVERRLSVVDEVEATINANLKRAERLRQAILKRAFEGKLVPQDPSDEPASVLLERIRASREQTSEATHRTPKAETQQKRSRPKKAEQLRMDGI